MPGDPLRSAFIAETFLENPRLVNNVRGIQGYTGTYRGVPVSVMASGMGMPSMGIYCHELYKEYEVENILRIGSAGATSKKLKLRDVGMYRLQLCSSVPAARNLRAYCGLYTAGDSGQRGPEYGRGDAGGEPAVLRRVL